MSRIVSIRLDTVHSATAPPAHSSQPDRFMITGSATGSRTVATELGSARATEKMIVSAFSRPPMMSNSAAPRMKKGKIASIDR